MIDQYICKKCKYKFEVTKQEKEKLRKIKCPLCKTESYKDYKTINIDESKIRRGSNKI